MKAQRKKCINYVSISGWLGAKLVITTCYNCARAARHVVCSKYKILQSCSTYFAYIIFGSIFINGILLLSVYRIQGSFLFASFITQTVSVTRCLNFLQLFICFHCYVFHLPTLVLLVSYCVKYFICVTLPSSTPSRYFSQLHFLRVLTSSARWRHCYG